MVGVPLGFQSYKRQYGQEPEIRLVNRFIEEDPTNQVEKISLLSRPGTTAFGGAGSGPITALAHQQGVFNDDLFYVSGDAVFRWDGVNAPIGLLGSVATDTIQATTFVAGPGYEHFFIADGISLKYYDGPAAATATLTVTPASPPDIVATDTVTIAGVYYEWTAGSVDAGTPAGTMAAPWLVVLGADDEVSLTNMAAAINASGIAGTTYSTALAQNTAVEAPATTPTSLSVRARVRGTGGNAITLAETGANIAWGSATLAGGGNQQLNQIITPDDVGMVSLATLASFVVAVVSNSQRFYFIRPGEVTIDPIDFAEAESEPDELIDVTRVGDALYFFGQSSTEVWYASADPLLPFLRQQGLAFSQGIRPGTFAQLRNTAFVVGEDKIVYKVANGNFQRISTHGIEERIRLGLAAQP